MMAKQKEIMTAKDVAEYLNIHLFTVHKFAREGKIPAFKIGTDWRFHRRHIESWIREKVAYNVERKERRQKRELFERKSGDANPEKIPVD